MTVTTQTRFGTSRLANAVGRGLLAALLALGVSGCGWFGGGGAAPEKPAPLQRLENPLQLERVWSRSVGSGDARAQLKFAPALVGEQLFATGRNGRVVAMNANDGSVLWRSDTKLKLVAGPGASDRLVAVAAKDGEVQALDSVDGNLMWRVQLSSEVLAAPTIAQDWVLVRTNDNALYALSAVDGQMVWVLRQAPPRLSMRGTGAPVVSRGKVYAGFDNGHLVAASVRDGETLWEAPVAVPTGRGDLERMVDVDSQPLVRDSDVYAVAFQGRVVSIAVESGRILWAQDVSSVRNLGIAGDSLLVTDTRSQVHAYDRYSSNQLWQQDGLKLRGVSGPVFYAGHVIVGDDAGYLHLLNPQDGAIVGRVRVDSSAIVTQPVVANGLLYVQSADGRVAAYRDPSATDDGSSVPESFDSQLDEGFDSPKSDQGFGSGFRLD